MNCEIEFLPVGEGSKGGDAIVVRYGEVGSYELMIIDGGNVESGKELVSHVQKHFGYNAIISHVVLTHCDTDHASGLREVLAGLKVRNLWMHVPWLAAAGARQYFADKDWTDASLEKALREEYDLIDEIFEIALEKRVNIFQPFAGQKIGPFTVLSPHQEVYEILVPQFDRTPEPDQEALEAKGLWIGKPPGLFVKLMDMVVAKAQKWVPETWEVERLKDGGVTSATNESSVVLYGDFGVNRRVLLTGDAGVWALQLSVYYAGQLKLPMQDFMFVQIPHHGSRSNVGPSILNAILGPVRPKGSLPKFSAFVSAPKEDDTHPRKMVLNAFIRRGADVCATQGIKTVFRGGFPFRPGYDPVSVMLFASQVEDYD